MWGNVGLAGLVLSAFFVELETMAGKHGGAAWPFRGHSVVAESARAHVGTKRGYLVAHAPMDEFALR